MADPSLLPARTDAPSSDDVRMSVGEHLEELRRRVVLGLAGFVLTLFACLFFGQKVVAFFCKPLIDTLLEYELSPQLYVTEVGDAFMVFIRISMIVAGAISAPWLLYQLWQFVAVGLYPTERKYVTRYMPLSMLLLVAGMVFVYLLVLPWTLQFLIGWASQVPLPPAYGSGQTTTLADTAVLGSVPMLDGDPADPPEGAYWFSRPEGRLKIFVEGQTRVIPFGPQNLIAPIITLPQYVSLVVSMLVLFALAFQLPLGVLAVERMGVVNQATLRKNRKFVYFGLTILACAITPGDLITASLALVVPLALLYELGIWLSAAGGRKAKG